MFKPIGKLVIPNDTNEADARSLLSTLESIGFNLVVLDESITETCYMVTKAEKEEW